MAARVISFQSSSSGEEDGTSAFQLAPRPTPAKKPALSPAPANSRSTAGSDKVASSDEIGENGVILKRQRAAPKSNGAIRSSPRKKSKVGESSAAAAPPPPPPPPPAAEEEEDGAANPDAETITRPSLDPVDRVVPHHAEIGENGAILKRQRASPKSIGAVRSSPRKKSKVGESSAAAPPPPPPPLAAEEEEDAATEEEENAEDPDAETMTPPSVHPPPPPPQNEEPYDAEKLLKEKSDKYPYLWQIVLGLEKEHSLPSLRRCFLKLAEAKTARLDRKVKKFYISEVKNQLRHAKHDEDVIALLMDLMP